MIFGAITDSSEIIRGDWFEHKLVELDDNHFGLNVEEVSFNDYEVSTGFNAILMSSVNNLMYIGGNEMDFYLSWAEKLSEIEGVTCEMFNKEP